jgi:hypothetical protein
MGCPIGADVIGANTTTPGRRGQLASIVAKLPGQFTSTVGGVAQPATSGSIELKKGGTIFQVMTPSFWSGGAVTFTIPLTLPTGTGTGTDTWKAWLRPTGETQDCGPYDIVVETATPQLSCPGSVRVNDGVIGVTVPASRSGQFQLAAESGYFGDANSTAGSVQFTGAKDASGAVTNLSVPAQHWWTPTSIVVSVPAGLPQTQTATTWLVTVTALGSTSACGPYEVLIEPAVTCPVSAIVLNGPVAVGALDPVTVIAVGGTFGDVLSKSGRVLLRKQGQQDVVIPQSDIVWTPAAVTFVMPRTMPAAKTQQKWQVYLGAASTAPGNECGPYELNVLVRPVLAPPPLVTVSERAVELVVIGVGPNAYVRFYGLDAAGQDKQIATDPNPRRTAVGLAPQMPTVRQIQESAPSYDTDQLTLLLKIEVYDPDSDAASVRLPTTVILPPPNAGVARRVGDRLLVGRASTAPSELGDISSNEWIGGPDHGRVVLYFDTPEGELLPLLELVLERLAGAASNADLGLDQPTVDQLTVLRDQLGGQQLTVVTEQGKKLWREEGIVCELPAGVELGVVVVWRDHLPSAPRVFGLDLCDPEFLRPLILEAWKPLAPSIPVPAGTEAAIGVERIPGAANVLTRLLDADANRSISFTYSLTKNGSPPAAGDLGFPASGTIDKAGKILSSLLRPRPSRMGASPNFLPLDSDAWTVTLSVSVSGIPGCDGPVVVSIPPLQFTQLGVPIPGFVFGYGGKNYLPDVAEGRSIYIWLSPDNPLIALLPPDKVVDQKDTDPNAGLTQATAKALILDRLNQVQALLKLLAMAGFSPVSGLPGSGAPLAVAPLKQLNHVITELGLTPAADVIVDGFSENDDLGYHLPHEFGDTLYSIFMIGLPQGNTLELFEHGKVDAFTGKSIAMRIPAGNVIASFWTLDSLASDTVAPETPPGRARDTFLGNKISSSRWS